MKPKHNYDIKGRAFVSSMIKTLYANKQIIRILISPTPQQIQSIVVDNIITCHNQIIIEIGVLGTNYKYILLNVTFRENCFSFLIFHLTFSSRLTSLFLTINESFSLFIIIIHN